MRSFLVISIRLRYFGKAKEVEGDYINIFGCEVGAIPFKYLCVPIHYMKLLNKEWKQAAEDMFERKIVSFFR
jgi:hypothetical protein